ncbi:putative protease [Peptoniphilus asaccharolyticus DSM 20463]|uniref:Putative protease n=1 Tax=Peptoniphilus asaccharolyticus DSM 20463 TaxID=573058 RepID=A0A1W1UAY0_PEPAS|nr:U32 family peptidase [Peptoniphilus asaccharolyticus]MBL7575572.1 U32 family peptidase [Peptoniphilus asaccharolyticus]SMB78219.1 putative protease [Peptoniphilus asaccharolyticus DSM 20463]
MIDKVELLAPAGGMESLISAVKAGADAIYLGTDKFSARAKAFNFDREQVKLAVEYAHLRGVKIYVTANILLLDNEIEDAFRLVEYLNEIGVDGIIVQDLGFGTTVAQSDLPIEVHASTQMAINNLYGAKTIEDFGFERVVLARETGLEDMKLVDEFTNLDVEGFIHGALCVSFSGECLMSSMIGGRSGNRGDCAQACRKSYKIIGLDGREFESKYYISPKDLNSLNTLDELIDNGIFSLKIEGRMKNPEYVYQVVSAYRKAIDNKVTQIDKDKVEQIFSRGFTSGLAFGDFGKDFITVEKPSNRGREVGIVVCVKGDSIEVEFFEDISRGDGIEIFDKNKSVGFKVDRDYSKGIVKLNLQKRVQANSKIYRNYSENLDKEIKENLNSEVKYRDLSIKCKFKVGEQPIIKLNTKEFDVEFVSDYIVEKAQKKGVSKEKVSENISKLGGTVYNLVDLKLDVDEDIFIPISEINNLRRNALELLDKKYLSNREHGKIKYSLYRSKKKVSKNLSVEIYSIEDLKRIKNFDGIKICMPIDNFNREIEKTAHENNIKLSGVFKKFQSTRDLEKTLEILKSTDIFEEVYINNLSQISLLKDFKIDKVADIGLNVFNKVTVSKLLEMGFIRVCLSPELNKEQIREIAKEYGEYIEVVSHGLLPVMTMLHCPMSVNLACSIDSNCEKCKYSKGFYLEDARGEKFLVERSSNISEIFNSHPIMLSDKIKTFMDCGIESFKLNLREDVYETIKVYKNILNREAFDGINIKNNLIDKYGNITYGHYNRGVLNG